MRGTHTFPKALISFVAKTGFITKETWEEFFFAGGKCRWKYQAWADLARRGYLVAYPYRTSGSAYVLNRKSRDMASFIGEKAARPPVASQLDHDEVLNRGLLLAERKGVVAHWIPEPELKALGSGTHRIASRGSLIKYPDALVQVVGREKALPLAIELEQTLKSRERYVQILGAYSAMNDISGVLFICKSSAIERAIRETAKRIYFPVDEIKLGFLPQEEWQRDPCQMALH